jgi:hypothetical protein
MNIRINTHVRQAVFTALFIFILDHYRGDRILALIFIIVLAFIFRLITPKQPGSQFEIKDSVDQ